MDFLKRQLWLVITLGVMVILSVALAVISISYAGRWSAHENVLAQSSKKVGGGRGATVLYYNKSVVDKLNEATEFRSKRLAVILDYLRQQRKRTELLPGIFERTADQTELSRKIYKFRASYPEALARFADLLGGVRLMPGEATLGQAATMYIRTDAFYTAPWIQGEAELPRDVMRQVAYSQDDLWLQDDIVQAIRRTNEDYFLANLDASREDLVSLRNELANPDADRDAVIARLKEAAGDWTVARAVVKELHKIDIGASCLSDSFSGLETVSTQQRFLYIQPPVEDTGTGVSGSSSGAGEVESSGRAGTLTGRASDNNAKRYWVLPFKVTLIVDAANFAELLRQLTGTRSFITILNVKYDVVPETQSTYSSMGLLRPKVETRLQVYGTRPLARLTLWGESLLFRLSSPTEENQETP